MLFSSLLAALKSKQKEFELNKDTVSSDLEMMKELVKEDNGKIIAYAVTFHYLGEYYEII